MCFVCQSNSKSKKAIIGSGVENIADGSEDNYADGFVEHFSPATL